MSTKEELQLAQSCQYISKRASTLAAKSHFRTLSVQLCDPTKVTHQYMLTLVLGCSTFKIGLFNLSEMKLL